MRTRRRLFSVLPRLGLGVLLLSFMAHISCADSALLPERVAKTAQERIDADAQLDFERDGTGRVVAVVLHQNGQNLRAPCKTQ